VAGPAMNLLLPFALLPPVFLLSRDYDEVYGSLLGSVDEGSPAYAGGLREGDRLVALDGEPVEAFWQVSRAVEAYDPARGPLRATVLRPGRAAPLTLEVTPREVREGEGRRYRVGLQPISQSLTVLPTPGGALAGAGARPFDTLTRLEGEALSGPGALAGALARLGARPDPDAPVAVEVERLESLGDPLEVAHRAARVTLRLPPPREWAGAGAPATPEEALARLGARLAGPCVTSVDPGAPAAAALRVGDCLSAVDGQRHSLAAFVDSALRAEPARPKRALRWRDGVEEEVELRLAREALRDPLGGEEEYWRLGFTLAGLSRGAAPLDGALEPNGARWSFAWWQTRQVVGSGLRRTLEAIGGLFVGEVSPRQLGGPVTIFYLAGREASAGWERFMFLMVSLSLSIALMNLLPVPGLDGGHILVALVELVTRRALPLPARRALLVAGSLALVGLMLFVLLNDLARMWQLSQG